MSFLRRALGVIALLALAFPALAQTDRGVITGTIVDPTGAVVANAPIELVNTETGALYSAAASDTGNYTFGQLPGGVYKMTLAVPGFRILVVQHLTLAALQTIRQDIALELGTAAESITVNALVSQLQTEGGAVNYNISAARLISLPVLPIGAGFASNLGIRNPMAALGGLAPGVYGEPNLNFRVNGAPSNTQSVRLDGQDSTGGIATAAQAQTQPSVEALQEVTIQTATYAAEFGQAGGGVINYTTKSGTNKWHGSLYNYNSNEFYSAAQSFKKEKPKLRRNDYGGTLGGPVWIPKVYNGRDRTFFFWGYEVFDERGVVSTITPTVPTEAYRAGNFATALTGRPIQGSPADSLGRPARDGEIYDPASEFPDPLGRRLRNPFPSNAIPAARFDPSAVKLLALIPKPTTGSLVNNYNNPYPANLNTKIPSLKLDHSLGARQKLAFYWSTTESARAFCFPTCNSEGFPAPITATAGVFIKSYTLRLNYDYTLTPAMLLHLGAGFLNNDFKIAPPTTRFDVAGVLGIAGAKASRFPFFTGMIGANSSGGMDSMGASNTQRYVEQKPTYNASLAWVKGNHTYKFGSEFRTEGIISYSSPNAAGRFQFSPSETGNPWFFDAGVTINGGAVGFPFARLLLGRVNQVQLSALPATRQGRKYLGLFAQDTWKVTHKLTLDYGLRYDYANYAKEQYGRTPAFSGSVANATAGGHPGATIFEATCNCTFARNYPHAWGPRAGLAYQWNGKTVLRGGFGVTYTTVLNGVLPSPGANQIAGAPAAGDPAMILSQGIPLNPIWPDLRANLFPDASFAGAPTVFDQNSGRPARQLQWSAGVQREITGGLLVEATYIGTRGVWWRTGTLSPYNHLSPGALQQQFGLDITNAADRAILAAQVGQAAAQRFRNQLPFTGYPTGFSVARSLTNYPQFLSTLGGQGPVGKTWYDALQLKVTKRFSHGLEANYSYSYSKELQLGAENDGGGGVVNDVFNRDTNKQFSSFSRPNWHVLAVGYTLPKWGVNRWLNQLAADWTVTGAFGYGSGQPILIPLTAQATSNLGSALLRGTRAERVPGVPLFLQDLNCHCFDPGQVQVLNPAAWKDPVAGTFSPSAAYYNDYRYRRRPQESMSVGRIFRFGERAHLLVRAEFNNVFNRTQYPNPISSGYSTAVSRTTASIADGGATVTVNNTGFGVIATQPLSAVIGERTGLLVGRLTF
ncbi:MAG: TonB-dependent receptor [Acidobacteriota bacterium]